MDLATLSTASQVNPSLQSVPFECLLLFLASVAAIKNNIVLLQPSDQSPGLAPAVLPRTAQAFLSAACGLSVGTILESWSVFKDLAWGSDSFASLICPPLPIFHQHGIPHGYSMSTLNCRDATHPVTNYLFAGTRSLYPPSHFCQASSCPRTSKGMHMMQAEQ